MRQITVKYKGDCRKCGQTLEIGTSAIYERRVGIYCPGCAPTDSEEIREVRQEAADRKADRLEGWASKRIERATAQLNSYPEIRHDIAFCTQPGRIPFRDRMNRADERAFESLNKAREMEARASSLRHVQVKGDREKRRQAERDYNLTWLKVGMTVDTIVFGHGIVKRINKKTATISNTGQSKTATFNVELAWLRPVKQA